MSKANFDFKGIIHIGKFENHFQIFNRFIVPFFSTKKRMKKLASFEDVKSQKQYYEKIINNQRLNFIFNIFFGFNIMGKLGRDKAFYDYVDEKENSSKNIKNTFDYGITHITNYDNSYINYVLTNTFNDNCLPIYLKRENYEIIKSRINKIEVLHSGLLDIKGKYDFFNLSDIFEYMSEEEFNKNVDILLKLSTDNARIVYYNMQNRRYIDKDFILLKDLSKKLTLSTKSYFYRDFLVYERKLWKKNIKWV